MQIDIQARKLLLTDTMRSHAEWRLGLPPPPSCQGRISRAY